MWWWWNKRVTDKSDSSRGEKWWRTCPVIVSRRLRRKWSHQGQVRRQDTCVERERGHQIMHEFERVQVVFVFTFRFISAIPGNLGADDKKLQMSMTSEGRRKEKMKQVTRYLLYKFTHSCSLSWGGARWVEGLLNNCRVHEMRWNDQEEQEGKKQNRQ